jgi:poly-beta-1,6-N-acetyl-D-glucosamine synthase
MTITIFFFWTSLAILFYSYFGYGIFVFLVNIFKRPFYNKEKNLLSSPALPVTLIITAYNEEAVLEQKIKNTLAIDYPGNKLEVIIITDGTTDDSLQIFDSYPKITLLH